MELLPGLGGTRPGLGRTTKQQLERSEKARRATAARLRENEQALAAATRRLNNALAAVAARDATIQARERELREVRNSQLLPEPVPREPSEIATRRADPVDSFLEATGLSHHLETFRREEIDLDILRDVEIEDLQYLGLGDDECRRFVAARDANF